MNANATPQFEIPKEMRAVAEQSVDQAKVAFQQLMSKGVSLALPGWQ